MKRDLLDLSGFRYQLEVGSTEHQALIEEILNVNWKNIFLKEMEYDQRR